ncbi:MAG: hypothetical protein ACM3W4_06125, partial [Ignavibacteriales bacterium]
MALPFSELSWENFERLCYQLARRSGQIEYVQRYGRQGQAQQGIDIYARKVNGRYEAWQSKRDKTFSADKLRKAVAAFKKGSWYAQTDTFYLAVQAALDDTEIQDEIEAQAKLLAADDITFIPLGGDPLADKVLPHQDLIHAFFGKAWLEALHGQDADPAVLGALDGAQFASVREQLAKVYRARFNALDPGAITSTIISDPPGAPAVPGLLERYTIPDIVVREQRAQQAIAPTPAPAAPSSEDGSTEQPRASGVSVQETVRRTPVTQWLSEGDQIAVVADAGAGKSTLLRCIALDLLGDQDAFPDLAVRWGQRLPVFISFARWA